MHFCRGVASEQLCVFCPSICSWQFARASASLHAQTMWRLRTAYKAFDQANIPIVSSFTQLSCTCRCARARDNLRHPLKTGSGLRRKRDSPGLLFWAHGLAVGDAQVLQSACEAIAPPDPCEVALLLGQVLQATKMPCNRASCIQFCSHMTKLCATSNGPAS